MKLLRIVFLFCFISASAQTDDFVKTDGISHNIHRQHVGKIVFLSRRIPLDSLHVSDFLKRYEFTPESNLNIRVFLDNSIINHQHKLSPETSLETLEKSGNYQFRFLVDDKLVYSENIHYGCGLRKSTTTTFSVPFADTSGADWWSVYLFNRFLENGGNAALAGRKHKMRVEMRPYLKFGASDPIVGGLIASGEIQITIKPIKASRKQLAIQPIKSHPDFKISAQKFDKSKIEHLNKAIVEREFRDITSIVVLQNGELALEEYFGNANRETLHDVRSVGKSFTSTFVGMAIQDGFLKSENQTLSEFYDLKNYANPSQAKENVQLRDLLTMSSAFDGSDSNSDSPGNEENMYPTPDWVKFALDLPIDPKKTNGKQWDYFTAGMIVLGDVLNRSVPGGLEKYAQKKLFEPMNIESFQWQYTPQNVVNTAGSLQLTSIDYAKFGQLYQNRGLWNGQQILRADWVDKTFSHQISIPDRPEEYYGLLFWNKTFQVGEKKYETYYCAGNGGNRIFIFDDLVVVITAKAFNRPYAHPQVDKIMQDFILPAFAESRP